MSITLKPQFLKVALIAVMITGMPVSHAKSPAQADKVLRVAFPAPDDGFDMVKTSNFYSGNIADVIFERLLQYDYLANPVKLVPATAQSLPVIKKMDRSTPLKSSQASTLPMILHLKASDGNWSLRIMSMRSSVFLIQRIMRHLFPLLTINCLVQMRWWSKPIRQENLITMHRLRE